MFVDIALVLIHAYFPIAVVSVIAGARVAAVDVGTSGISMTSMRTQVALVVVFTSTHLTRTSQAGFTRTSVATFGVSADTVLFVTFVIVGVALVLIHAFSSSVDVATKRSIL